MPAVLYIPRETHFLHLFRSPSTLTIIAIIFFFPDRDIDTTHSHGGMQSTGDPSSRTELGRRVLTKLLLEKDAGRLQLHDNNYLTLLIDQVRDEEGAIFTTGGVPWPLSNLRKEVESRLDQVDKEIDMDNGIRSKSDNPSSRPVTDMQSLVEDHKVTLPSQIVTPATDQNAHQTQELPENDQEGEDAQDSIVGTGTSETNAIAHADSVVVKSGTRDEIESDSRIDINKLTMPVVPPDSGFDSSSDDDINHEAQEADGDQYAGNSSGHAEFRVLSWPAEDTSSGDAAYQELDAHHELVLTARRSAGEYQGSHTDTVRRIVSDLHVLDMQVHIFAVSILRHLRCEESNAEHQHSALTTAMPAWPHWRMKRLMEPIVGSGNRSSSVNLIEMSSESGFLTYAIHACIGGTIHQKVLSKPPPWVDAQELIEHTRAITPNVDAILARGRRPEIRIRDLFQQAFQDAGADNASGRVERLCQKIKPIVPVLDRMLKRRGPVVSTLRELICNAAKQLEENERTECLSVMTDNMIREFAEGMATGCCIELGGLLSVLGHQTIDKMKLKSLDFWDGVVTEAAEIFRTAMQVRISAQRSPHSFEFVWFKMDTLLDGEQMVSNHDHGVENALDTPQRVRLCMFPLVRIDSGSEGQWNTLYRGIVWAA